MRSLKWNKALSAEDAALFAMGLDEFRSLSAAQAELESYSDFSSISFPVIDSNGATLDPAHIMVEIDLFAEKLAEANGIYLALIEELPCADPWFEDEATFSVLEIAIRARTSEFDTGLVPERCTITKKSLAMWFWEHDKEIAKKFYLNIEDVDKGDKSKKSEVPAATGPKTTNTHLKIIRALSDALIKGLTGVKSTDADAVLLDFEKRGVDFPVTSKTLAKYLEEAKELV